MEILLLLHDLWSSSVFLLPVAFYLPLFIFVLHISSHSLSFSAEIKNQWSYISTPYICLHGTDRDIFIFSNISYHSSSSVTLPLPIFHFSNFQSPLYYFLDPRSSLYLFFYFSFSLDATRTLWRFGKKKNVSISSPVCPLLTSEKALGFPLNAFMTSFIRSACVNQY